MSDKTGIEWTDATWNPLRGCSRVSEGCKHCYAEGVAARFSGPGLPYEGLAKRVTRPDGSSEARWTGKVAFAGDKVLTQPLRWQRPRKIFVNSMSDLFHESVPDEWIDRIFAVMALAPQHTFQVLTKRPERMRAYLTAPGAVRRIYELACDFVLDLRLPVALIPPGVDERLAPRGLARVYLDRWPLPNVWLGTSVEDQVTADTRIPYLLATPAAVRFISAEPLLGPIDLREQLWVGEEGGIDFSHTPRQMLHWVIVGGESGAGARPMHPDWARRLRDQCAAARVAFHFKQWGEWGPVCALDEATIDRCYRKAPERDPEAVRRCLVSTHVLHRDGSQHHNLEPLAWLQGWGAMMMLEVGKKAAGRLLDGVEHDGFPT